MALRSVDDTLSELLADARPVPPREIALDEALGAVLAAPVIAPIAVPPADNSAMDGYALRFADFTENTCLPISQRIPAGCAPMPLAPGSCARLFTGAEIPGGADTVVAQEDTELRDAGICILASPKQGQHIRPRGQDIALGATLLEAGHRLAAVDLGLLASVGVSQISARAGIRVALMSTGDELREPGEALEKGAIYNSNRPMLSALLKQLGCEVIDLGIVRDSPEATQEALDRARRAADVVISTGGVSVGEEDHVKAQIEKMGRLSLWKLAIKPGKPLAYGWLPRANAANERDEIPFFGLPGNPVSSFVTFSLLVRPYLLKMLGALQFLPTLHRARVNFDWPKAGGRQEYLRARVAEKNGEFWADIHPQQSSGALSSVAWSNALLVVPVGATFAKGEWAECLYLKDIT
ncbi:molybdopterin molybdotransferase MoeA [Spongiibacter sp. KMU-158]|uniref:Molybdopterin molybdenumtransferase n=1 Tax=Spongiibacter pelagi TaxID=2760804 RepID=A0A927C4C5_9GAMM|nr:gephyrin-like molybdotransferase Glp [Spongiibacter pelagi]MBD2859361.1 molybdopterin molybdotransferase MoeA [Spongiibacter pelagi]